jgi:hypothetical protein
MASLMIATGGAAGPSPIEKKRPDGFEKIRAHLVRVEPQALGHRSLVPFDRDRLFPAVANEQVADETGVLHARNRLNRLEHALVKVHSLRGGAEGRRDGDLHQ